MPAATTHRLPGDTTWEYDSWEVSSAGGRESFLVVASLDAVEELESALALLESASPLDPGEFLRGDDPAGPEPDTAPSGAEAALAAALEVLAASGSEKVVIHQITLENPR